ncbi:MAG: heme-binding domain-containing protein, partial [Planctomycetota bacterium]
AGLSTGELPVEITDAERIVDPYDADHALDMRARSYLHANCAFCHVQAGGGNSAMDLEITAGPDEAMFIDEPPVHTKFGIKDARIVASGDSQRSILLHRVRQRGRGQMPPLATTRVDERAVELLREWISELSPPGPEAETEE